MDVREPKHGKIGDARAQIVEQLEQLMALMVRHLTDRDISFTSVSTLSGLERRGPARLTALARAEGVSQPSMTQLVQRLERQGLVTRVHDPDDGRVVVVAITDAGRRLLAQRRQARADRLAVLLAGLPPEDERTLYAALPAIRHLVHDATHSPPPAEATTS